jgi:hypothetical protein
VNAVEREIKKTGASLATETKTTVATGAESVATAKTDAVVLPPKSPHPPPLRPPKPLQQVVKQVEMCC